MNSIESAALLADANEDTEKASELYFALVDEPDVSSETCLNAAALFYLGMFEPPFIIKISDAVVGDPIALGDRFLDLIKDEPFRGEAAFWRIYARHLIFPDDRVDAKMVEFCRHSECPLTFIYDTDERSDFEAFDQKAERLRLHLGDIDSERKRFVLSVMEGMVMRSKTYRRQLLRNKNIPDEGLQNRNNARRQEPAGASFPWWRRIRCRP